MVGKFVGVCGEVGGDFVLVLVFVGFGVILLLMMLWLFGCVVEVLVVVLEEDC